MSEVKDYIESLKRGIKEEFPDDPNNITAHAVMEDEDNKRIEESKK